MDPSGSQREGRKEREREEALHWETRGLMKRAGLERRQSLVRE